MAQEEQNAALVALKAEADSFKEYLNNIVGANNKMVSTLISESSVTLNKVSENWVGAMSESFTGKAQTKVEHLIADCGSISLAAAEIRAAYINNILRPGLAANGVDQETIDENYPVVIVEQPT